MRVLAVTLILVGYLRLYTLIKCTWLLIIPSQLSVFAKNIPLTFNEATNTERTGFLASFLRQIKKNRREVDSWLIDFTNRGNRCLYHVRIFRDLYKSLKNIT